MKIRSMPSVFCFVSFAAGSHATSAQSDALQPTAGEPAAATAGADSGDPLDDFGSTQRGPKPEQPDAAPAESALHFKITIDYTTAYYFRGIRQEDRGFIMQPAGELGVDLYKNDAFSIGAFAGIWNSFHDRATGAAQNDDIVDKWYEADFYLGVGGSLGNLGYSLSYIAYTSPADAFSTVDEVDFSLTYNDSEWWGDSGFTLTPSLAFAIEVGDDYTDGADTERGLYLQPGITPAFAVSDVPVVGDVSLSFPVTIGLSLDDYYEDATGEDQTLGFVSLSAKAAFALPVPAEYGAWTFTAGLQFLYLGDTTADINDDDETVLIGAAGITIVF